MRRDGTVDITSHRFPTLRQIHVSSESGADVWLVKAGEAGTDLSLFKTCVQVFVVALQCIVLTLETDGNSVRSWSGVLHRYDDVIVRQLYFTLLVVDDKGTGETTSEIKGDFCFLRKGESDDGHARHLFVWN